MFRNYEVEGSRGHLEVLKRTKEDYKQKVKERTGEGPLP